MKPLIINLLTFLRTMNKNKNKKRRRKEWKKSTSTTTLFSKKRNTSSNPSDTSPNPSDTSPNPSEGGEHKPLTNLIFLPRYCYKRALEYGHKSGLLARYLSLYSRREQTLYYVHHSHKVGLPPFGRVGVGFWRTGPGIALQSQPLCHAISTILRVNLSHFARRYSLH